MSPSPYIFTFKLTVKESKQVEGMIYEMNCIEWYIFALEKVYLSTYSNPLYSTSDLRQIR